jgi:putative transposase
MYARGMSTREIQGHLRKLYGLEVSPDLVSAVTDAVLDEVAEWQNRPLERLHPLVFLDALRVSLHLRRRLSARCQGRSPGLQHQTLRGELAVHLREQRLGQTTLSQNGAEAAQGGLASGRLRLRPGWHHPS